MGCHTWIYIPKRDLREEDIAYMCNEIIKELKNNWIMNMTLEDYLSYEKTQYDGPKTFEEELPRYKEIYNKWHEKMARTLETLEENPNAITDVAAEDIFTTTVELDGETYYNFACVMNGDNIFRVGNSDAPEGLIITSKQDFIEYAKKAETAYVEHWTDGIWDPITKDTNKEAFYEHVEAKLEELYSKWPNAVADFG